MTQNICLKAGQVGQTLLSTDKLEKQGWETILSADKPRLRNVTTGEVLGIHKNPGRLPYVNMWANLWESDKYDNGVKTVEHSVFRRHTPG